MCVWKSSRVEWINEWNACSAYTEEREKGIQPLDKTKFSAHSRLYTVCACTLLRTLLFFSFKSVRCMCVAFPGILRKNWVSRKKVNDPFPFRVFRSLSVTFMLMLLRYAPFFPSNRTHTHIYLFLALCALCISVYVCLKKKPDLCSFCPCSKKLFVFVFFSSSFSFILILINFVLLYNS